MVVVVLAIPLAALLKRPSGSKPCSPSTKRGCHAHTKHAAVGWQTLPSAEHTLLAAMQPVSCQATAVCLAEPPAPGMNMQLCRCALTGEMRSCTVHLYTRIHSTKSSRSFGEQKICLMQHGLDANSAQILAMFSKVAYGAFAEAPFWKCTSNTCHYQI